MFLTLYLKKPVIIPGDYPKIDKKFLKNYKMGTLEQSLKLGDFFMDYINDDCDIAAAAYECDYWDSEHCKKIVNWIENNMNLIIENELEEFFKVICEYCKKAVELDTGVGIDI